MLFVHFFILTFFGLIPKEFISMQQINLGSFSLQRSPFTGDIQLGLGQNGNILGFGGDRHFGLNLGPGRLGAKTDNGLLLGGHRFGLDSQLGYQEGRGFDLGSFLNLFQPVSQLLHGHQSPPPPPSPPSTFPAPAPWLNRESAAQGPMQPPPAAQMPPTLIPPSASNWAGNGQANIEEQFPPSFGEGWQSEEEMDPFERGSGLAGRGELPWSVRKSAGEGRSGIGRGEGGRVTTEGRFRNGGGGPGVAADENGKHDGETSSRNGEKKTSNVLPVPNGLEPL